MSVYVWHDSRAGLAPWLNKLTVQHGSSEANLADAKVIVHWCGDDRAFNKKKIRILNHSKYTYSLYDHHKIHRTLLLHDISYSPPQQFENPLFTQYHEIDYLIPVFQMDALAILHYDTGHSLTLKRNTGTQSKLLEINTNQKTGTLRKLERYAVRAVYALGLDYACVHARIQRSGRAVITRIDVDPIQNEWVGDLFAKAINEYEEYVLNSVGEYKFAVFGMDPEFLLRNIDGRIVPASRFLQAKGDVGYDSATVLGRKQTHPLAELRPAPSANVPELVNNLRKTMWNATKQITDHSLQWIAGGMPVIGLPLGGHLHISGMKLQSGLIRALDNYLALPLIMIEDTSTKRRRRRYGRLGDVRRPFHGGFEYRTLPSWIVSPRVTKGVIALTHLIVQHYEELIDRPLDRLNILIAYKEGNKHILEPIVRSLWLQLERTTGYVEHRVYLDPLKEWILEHRIWNEQSDFRAAWRIPPFH